jgi:hypothetical protein
VVGNRAAAAFFSRMRIITILLWLLASSITSWARPPLDLSKVDSLDLAGYRPLLRGDFRGKHAPAQFLHSPVLPVAVSCIYVVLNPGARIYALPKQVDGATIYVPEVKDLSFQAVLSRSCSWWNDQHEISPAYVLEHEQIHFALYEVAARRLNERADRLLKALEGSSDSPQAAVAAAQRFLHQSLDRTMQDVVEDNVRFDRETSFGFQPDRQQQWRMTVEGDLKQLSEHAVDLELRPPASR